MTVITLSHDMDEALAILETSDYPIAQQFVKKYYEEMGESFFDIVQKLDRIEELTQEVENLQAKLECQAAELKAEQAKVAELKKRIEQCSTLLWKFRPNECARRSGSFGPEYEWSEYPGQIKGEYAPDYDHINGSYLLLDDGEVQEVWVLPSGSNNSFSVTALYERVF